MLQPEFFSLFINPLDSAGIKYMVTGSLASTLYGEPRLTHDIDIVVMLKFDGINAFRAAFPKSHYYSPPPEIIAIELKHRPFAHFNLIHHDTGLKAYCYPFTGDPLQSWGLKHRRKVAIDDFHVWLAPPEYVIIRKLQYYREGASDKHLRDIRSMLDCLDTIDMEFLENSIQEKNLTDLWAQIQQM